MRGYGDEGSWLGPPGALAHHRDEARRPTERSEGQAVRKALITVITGQDYPHLAEPRLMVDADLDLIDRPVARFFDNT